MGEIIFIVGGARSGKSGYAERYLEALPQERFYVATCPKNQNDDTEMEQRISLHKDKRAGRGWSTVEETENIAEIIATLPGSANVLVDCITLWVNNLLFRHTDSLNDESISKRCKDLLDICHKRQGVSVFVSSEVGCGIVPERSLSRKYRDLLGRCNQVLAERADRVFMISCGIPTQIK